MEKVPSKVLSHSEEKALDQKVQDLKDLRDGVELQQGLEYTPRNAAEIDKEIKRLEALRASQGVPELAGADLDRVQAEETALRQDLQKGMPRWGTYIGMTPRDGSRYHELVNQIVKWESDSVRRAKVQRWKTLRRLLDPHDPKASSTVHLFPQ